MSDIRIEDYIPFGHANAVTRIELVNRTGLSDRSVRELINEARKNGACIINLSDGKGYFYPTVDEYMLLRGYIAQEESRAKDIFTGLKGCKAYLEDLEKGRITV